VPAQLGLDGSKVIAVVRPPPIGALYHRDENDRFDEVLTGLEQQADVAIVLLPRSREQSARYASRRVTIPAHAVDGTALLAGADLVVGGGGTMTREAALLGTPTYTVFMPELAAVDAELMRCGRIVDLRAPGTSPAAEKKRNDGPGLLQERGEAICATIVATVREAVSAGR
jgi:predicted glycosyltransferase